MNSKIFIIVILLVVGLGVFYGITQNPQGENGIEEREDTRSESYAVVLPILEYVQRRTFNGFGEFSQGSLEGYHVAQDIEYVDVLSEEVAVRAIAAGVVRQRGNVSGYGGVVVVSHSVGERQVNAIYGHLDLSSLLFQEGDSVKKGEFLANLGDHESQETDGERKHLHFALYEGEELRLQGYEPSSALVDAWINPNDFFKEYGYDMQSPSRMFDSKNELGGNTYPLQFRIPKGWEIEYVRLKNALNLYTLKGSGTSLERSQVFIQHFDAADFLTLQTVTIHQIQDVTVGAQDYTARRYDIEKKEGIAAFSGQPLWRNLRHIATDFRETTGYTRYFTIAARPGLDADIYEQILASMVIVERY